jgi:AraC family transcriptional regulator of adaptative response / DNA-3-methyladenine glycosylase II
VIDGNTPQIVKQAVMLINQGCTGSSTESDLGRCLGVAPEQLRALFVDHIGATPSSVARSSRAHFARQLLDESSLNIAETSVASGFRSVRQMNRVMKAVFRFTPSELRAKSRMKFHSGRNDGLRLLMPAESGADFDAALDYLAPRGIPGVESAACDTYRRMTCPRGDPGVIEIARSADKSVLEFTAHGRHLDGLTGDVARARRMLGIDVDIEHGRALLCADEMLGPFITQWPQLRIPGVWDRFEAAIRVIVGQHISVKAASTVAGRIAARYGVEAGVMASDGLGRLFPSPDRLVEADLSSAGIPRTRANAIQTFSKAVISGALNLYDPSELPELLEQLQDLPGIGPWTANMLAMRVWGHFDAFPSGDLGLRTAVARLTGESVVTQTRLSAIAERWRPWRSLAAAYLFRSLRGSKAGG